MSKLYDMYKVREKELNDDIIGSILSVVELQGGYISFKDDHHTHLQIEQYEIGAIRGDTLIHGNMRSEMYTIDKLTQYDLFRLLAVIEHFVK